ncbi:hypothetical protein [Amycolatopsis sp. CA-126428]|uniref:hypothetical protein n=1 Tax=Amycolatopsis sp. CA-126428 TaxID=2073158 RepID=UPI000CD313C9|nr:hypothetical protein [Amycolatopsis sp. CA-126428]
MTLLVIAPDTDETAARFAGFAAGQGIPAVVAHGFGRVGVSVRATRERVCRARLTFDGAEVGGILNRGTGGWGDEPDPDRAFAAAETYAALWSAVALWPGPVVNRPSEHGFLARLDPLELAGAGVVEPPRTVILNDGSAPGREVHRIPEWTVVDPDAPRRRFDVVQIADPGRTRRFVVAGAEVFELGAAGGRLARETADRVAPIVGWLRGRGTVFAGFRAELGAAVPRLADVSCWPGHELFPDLEDQVYAALLAGLTP